MVAGRGDDGSERVVILDCCAPRLQQLPQLQSRTFANILDVLFVGDAYEQDSGPRQAFSAPVAQGACCGFYDLVWCLVIDLPRELDEASGNIELARLPGEIIRIHWDAVSTQTWSRVERH